MPNPKSPQSRPAISHQLLGASVLLAALGPVAPGCVIEIDDGDQTPEPMTAAVSQAVDKADPCGPDAHESECRSHCAYASLPSNVLTIPAVDLNDPVTNESDGTFSCTVQFICDWAPVDDEPANTKCTDDDPKGSISPNAPPTNPQQPSCGGVHFQSWVKLDYRFATRAEAEQSCAEYPKSYGNTPGGQLVAARYCQEQAKAVNNRPYLDSRWTARMMTGGAEYSYTGLHYDESTDELNSTKDVSTLCCYGHGVPEPEPSSDPAPAPAGTAW